MASDTFPRHGQLWSMLIDDLCVVCIRSSGEDVGAMLTVVLLGLLLTSDWQSRRTRMSSLAFSVSTRCKRIGYLSTFLFSIHLSSCSQTPAITQRERDGALYSHLLSAPLAVGGGPYALLRGVKRIGSTHHGRTCRGQLWWPYFANFEYLQVIYVRLIQDSKYSK